MRRQLLAALLMDREAAADAGVDLDMLRNPARRREQPGARGVGVEPGVEYALGRGGEAAGDDHRHAEGVSFEENPDRLSALP